MYDHFTLKIVRVKRPYTIDVKYFTSQAKLPCPSSEARLFAFTVVVVCIRWHKDLYAGIHNRHSKIEFLYVSFCHVVGLNIKRQDKILVSQKNLRQFVNFRSISFCI